MARTVMQENLYVFRRSFCKIFCGRRLVTEDCPKDCRMKNLDLNNADSFQIRDMLKEVKHGI